MRRTELSVLIWLAIVVWFMFLLVFTFYNISSLATVNPFSGEALKLILEYVAWVIISTIWLLTTLAILLALKQSRNGR